MLFVKLKLAAASLIVAIAALVGLQTQVSNPGAEVKGASKAGPLELPLEIQQSLENNAQSLGPVAISYTEQLKSQHPEQEAIERLKLVKRKMTDIHMWFTEDPELFTLKTRRVIFQDQKIYTFRKEQLAAGDFRDQLETTPTINEFSFDGTLWYFYLGPPKGRGPGSLLTIRHHDNALINGIFRWSSNFEKYYFNPSIGLYSPITDPHRTTDFERRQFPLRAESSVLQHLRRGYSNGQRGKLLSLTNVDLEGKPHARIELEIENCVKADAIRTDFAMTRRRMTSIPVEEMNRWEEMVLAERKVPATKRLVYYLDPDLNYAVRQSEEWYDPTTLLQRCLCSDFVQLSDRHVWLPRTYQTDYYSYPTVPGVYFDEPIVSNVIQVSEMSGERVPDSQFSLDYTEPGIQIMDETTPPTTHGGRQTLSFHYYTGNTPEETQRNKELAQKQAIASSVGQEQNAVSPLRRSSFAFRWILLVNGIGVGLIGGYFIYRRFRRS